MAEHRDAPEHRWGSDGVATRAVSRSEGAARPRQDNVESGLDAADPLLEVPQAHAVRTRPMRALRFRIRRRHGRRLRERSQIAVSDHVGSEGGRRAAAEAFPPGDCRGSATCQRCHHIGPRSAAGKRGLRPAVPMPVVRPVRLGAIHGMRLRCRLCPDVVRHARVSGLRFASPVRCRCVPRLQPRLHAVGWSGRLRVRVPSVRRPRRVRCGPLFVWRLV